jgi:CheY-like chemotaxis protein
VIDTGTGIAAADQPRIFEPFFTTKEQGRGVGLGLASVYGMIRQSEGYIDVRSAPGAGTTFDVYLPTAAPDALAAARAAPAEPASAPEAVPAATSETILVVEDNAGVRDLVRELLAVQGYRVLVAPDGPAAIELAARHDGVIDLLLVDIVMPKMRGTDVARLISERRPGVRVVYMSGYDDSAFEEMRDATSYALLPKPFTGNAVADAVRAALDAPPPALATDRPQA